MADDTITDIVEGVVDIVIGVGLVSALLPSENAVTVVGSPSLPVLAKQPLTPEEVELERRDKEMAHYERMLKIKMESTNNRFYILGAGIFILVMIAMAIR